MLKATYPTLMTSSVLSDACLAVWTVFCGLTNGDETRLPCPTVTSRGQGQKGDRKRTKDKDTRLTWLSKPGP